MSVSLWEWWVTLMKCKTLPCPKKINLVWWRGKQTQERKGYKEIINPLVYSTLEADTFRSLRVGMVREGFWEELELELNQRSDLSRQNVSPNRQTGEALRWEWVCGADPAGKPEYPYKGFWPGQGAQARWEGKTGLEQKRMWWLKCFRKMGMCGVDWDCR